MKSEDLKQELREYFSNMTKDEVKNLFTDLGFEVEDGEGKVIYTENSKDFHYPGDSNGKTYSLEQNNNFKVTVEKKLNFVNFFNEYVA